MLVPHIRTKSFIRNQYNKSGDHNALENLLRLCITEINSSIEAILGTRSERLESRILLLTSTAVLKKREITMYSKKIPKQRRRYFHTILNLVQDSLTKREKWGGGS